MTRTSNAGPHLRTSSLWLQSVVCFCRTMSAGLAEVQVEEQILGLFRQMKMAPDISEWFSRMLRMWMQNHQKEARERAADIEVQLDAVRKRQGRLLNLRLIDSRRPYTLVMSEVLVQQQLNLATQGCLVGQVRGGSDLDLWRVQWVCKVLEATT